MQPEHEFPSGMSDEMKKIAEELIKKTREMPDASIEDDGIEMGDATPRDLIPDTPGCSQQLVSQPDGPPIGAVASDIKNLTPEEWQARKKQYAAEEQAETERRMFDDLGMTRADYEEIKKTTPPKSFKRISQARFEAPPETDVDKALGARLEKSPETVEAFKKRCAEIKEFYDSTNEGPAEYTMGRHREIVPAKAMSEARFSLPPRPPGFFSRIIYDLAAFTAKNSLRFLNWFMRPTIEKAERKRVAKINALIEKITAEMTTDNPEIEKSWEQVSAVRSRTYQIKDGETDEQARQRELDEIANAYDSSLWGDGKDSASIMATTTSWERVKSPSGNYHREPVETKFASKVQDKEVKVEDTIVVSPKLIDDPVLLRSKELKIASLRKKKMLTAEERNQLDELTRSLR